MTDAAQHVQMLEATKHQAVASLAAGIIAASGRPWSIQQALDLKTDIYFAMYPSPNSGAFTAWAKTREERLGTVHGPTA